MENKENQDRFIKKNRSPSLLLSQIPYKDAPQKTKEKNLKESNNRNRERRVHPCLKKKTSGRKSVARTIYSEP
jgi:hypothetical protein